MTTEDTAVTGVPGTGSGIDVYFQNPGEASTGKLFPTGNKQDILRPKHYPPVEVTMIDCSNPVVFIRAADLGLDGSEIKELTTNQSLLEHVEAIRGCAAAAFGFVDDPKDDAKLSLSVPKVSIISSPRDYVGSHGTMVKAAEMNICSRVISVGSFHKTHPITVGIATASAASIPGTIVSDLAKTPAENDTFYIGHPYGIMPIKLEMDGEHVVKGGTVRTARRIMDGYIYIND